MEEGETPKLLAVDQQEEEVKHQSSDEEEPLQEEEPLREAAEPEAALEPSEEPLREEEAFGKAAERCWPRGTAGRRARQRRAAPGVRTWRVRTPGSPSMTVPAAQAAPAKPDSKCIRQNESSDAATAKGVEAYPRAHEKSGQSA